MHYLAQHRDNLASSSKQTSRDGPSLGARARVGRSSRGRGGRGVDTRRGRGVASRGRRGLLIKTTSTRANDGCKFRDM